VVTRARTVDVPEVSYRPIPEALTKPLQEPPPPQANCTLGGKPVICVLDALGVIPEYQAFVQQCNDDRARTALFGRTDGQK